MEKATPIKLPLGVASSFTTLLDRPLGVLCVSCDESLQVKMRQGSTRINKDQITKCPTSVLGGDKSVDASSVPGNDPTASLQGDSSIYQLHSRGRQAAEIARAQSYGDVPQQGALFGETGHPPPCSYDTRHAILPLCPRYRRIYNLSKVKTCRAWQRELRH